MNDESKQNLVYLNLQLSARELDRVVDALLALLEDEERLWVSTEKEYGSKASPSSTFEKVVGHARTASIRLLCQLPRSHIILDGLMLKDKLTGIQWQIQPLIQTGEL
ncbi:MAG: DUF3240 family protein [Gammaproteobacteria bacterium]|nr:DUF3240 family protein [Gammaproteobacteria bacterium]